MSGLVGVTDASDESALNAGVERDFVSHWEMALGNW
jgi:hypothetical protein